MGKRTEDYSKSCLTGGLLFSVLRFANVDRCEGSYFKLDHWTPTDWGCAAAGEMGELCNLLKKRLRGDAVTDEQIAGEIADVVIYLDLLAARMGISLGKAVADKFNEVSIRKGSHIRLSHDCVSDALPRTSTRGLDK